MKARHKSTADLMREEAIRRGWKPIILDGQPVKPANRRKPANPGGNGAKK